MSRRSFWLSFFLKRLARPLGKKKSGELKRKVVGEVPADYQNRYGGVEVYPETVRQPAKVHIEQE
ncbi:MAG: hypothetical protein OSB73_24115 [Candidatus Latescibacteria bacterium]|nr:hypothetical protein [Candidatus Latescibacterota bacterium]